MSDIEYESELSLSEHETVYTHFRSTNQSATSVELTCTIDDTVTLTNQEDEKLSITSKLKSWSLKCCEVFVLCVLLATVWSALSVPSVFFAISQDSGLNGSVSPQFGNTCTEYTADTCVGYLRSFKQCLATPTNTMPISPHILIPESLNRANNEQILDNLNRLLGTNIVPVSSECLDALKPFACLYYLGLCDKTTGTIILPTMQQCDTLKTETCKALVDLARSYQVDLPNCVDLPSSTSPGPTSTCANSAPLAPIVMTTNRTCNERSGFHLNSNTSQCVPSCSDWSPYSELELRISNVVVIIAGAVAVLSGTAVLILSCIRCKQIFSYPSVFVVYQTVPTIFLGGLVLIAFVGQSKLFCNSENTVWGAINQPTPFCTATGVCLYYILMQLVLLWLFHIITIFWGVYWPFQASMIQASKKKVLLHIIAVFVAFVLPAIPVLIIHYLSPRGFTVTRFPPILCAASSLTFNFYIFMLPISIIIACGLTLLVLTFWKLVKKRILHSIRQTRVSTDWCSNARVLIILCYFVIFGIVVLSTFTVSMINFPLFLTEIRTYFECEAEGVAPGNANTCEESRQAVESLVNPVTTTIALVVLGFYPAVNLVYVAHCKELRDKCCCVPAREVQYAQPSTLNRQITFDNHGLIN